MNVTETLSSIPIENIGWTLLHSLWQIALVAGMLRLAQGLLKRGDLNARYLAAVAALLLSIALPIATYVRFATNSVSPTTPPVGISSDREILGFDPGSPGSSAKARSGDAEIDQEARLQTTNYLTATLVERLQPYLPFAVAAWLLGVALFSLRLAGGFWQLRRHRYLSIEPDDEWKERFAKVADLLGVGASVCVRVSSHLRTPVAFGIIRPLVIVPISMLAQLGVAEVELLIAHELIHIRRYDQWVGVLQGAIEAVLFYHPCTWWISGQVRLEREFATDAAVTSAFSDSRTVYARALASLEEVRSMTDPLPRHANAANGGNLMERINMILNRNNTRSTSASVLSAGLTLSLIVVLVAAASIFTSSTLVDAQVRSSGRKIAIGFVGIPPLDRGVDPPSDSKQTARLLIPKLKQYNVPAIGFLSGGMVSDGDKLQTDRANTVRMWRDAGLEIGIGGFKHMAFHDQPLDVYIANVEKNEKIAKEILDEKGLKLRYFSYPYLYTRNNDEHQRFEKWLAERGLTSVKYTIDNNEWMYSWAYDMARKGNDAAKMKEVSAAYLDYMAKMLDHYEAYSKEMFGRDIAETMVLTPSRLVADSTDELFGMILKRGYVFVSMDDALADPAFKTEERYEGKGGISWFERWTLTAGRRLRDEPQVDAAIQKAWDKEHPE
jgi:beta-lactamase regulating signal transducer with metallopeptidase domain/peptidoglycan/xylan/chitin deacetylase (PgdA/CDA1 family)